MFLTHWTKKSVVARERSQLTCRRLLHMMPPTQAVLPSRHSSRIGTTASNTPKHKVTAMQFFLSAPRLSCSRGSSVSADRDGLGPAHNAMANPDQAIERMYTMEITCKWATTGVLLTVFIGLVSVAGCIHVAEYFGSIIIGILAARWFFFNICKHRFEHLADRK